MAVEAPQKKPQSNAAVRVALEALNGKVDANHRELMMLLVGPTGTNGLNGKVKNIEARQDDTDERLDTFLRERASTCVGAALLKEHEKKQAVQEQVTEERREHGANRKNDFRKAMLAMWSALGVALIGVIGTVLVALLSK